MNKSIPFIDINQQTMPYYNNTDTYLRKPRSYREARKRCSYRVSRGYDKWRDVKSRKRYEMKFRTNRREDKLYEVQSFNDELDDDLGRVIESRYDMYTLGYNHLEKLIKADNLLSYYDNPVVIKELLISLLNTSEPVVLELDSYDIRMIMEHYWY